MPTSDSTQVIIVGGGIAGVGTAAALSRAGVPVIMLESGHIGQKASTLNQGWLHSGGIFAKDDPLLAQQCWHSLQETLAICPNCVEPDHDGMYYILSRTETLAASWLNAWNAAGIPVREVSRSRVLREVRGINPELLKHTFLLPDRAIRPHVLLEELAAAAANSGCEIRTGTTVVEVVQEDQRVRGVRTATGEFLAGSHVILATGTVKNHPMLPERNRYVPHQSSVEQVELKAHLIAIRPDLTRMPFVVVDRHMLNHLPHLQTSVFESGIWAKTASSEGNVVDPDRMAALWQDLKELFPSMNISEYSDVREWAGSTTQLLQVDQIVPGIAPRPAVIDLGANGGPQNVWRIATGKMTLWPIVAEEIRQRLLGTLGRGPIQSAAPPWELPSTPTTDGPSIQR
jgi:glycine/D-amino acid oxidase-like deaminating enzyme